ncbi:MAG: tRNA (adenosine(37)-N6)-threonylcarbamoyltransferase complex ATPase subunit type 1 TsaE [Geobacteraceae bacterium GWC2_55_20]|nr:MAG: tRNA (adenosine(37)-N6)-threonylcarbamoyltransferase complex ATPase subunit type 1 TsaE [Geobacteraceae bacterium GWC2_55_20]OGU25759.1 MAG: tRNA (adenosine(37)-N6)-threonylcarbamoyltransferase complex ATPase subunit type 1 TsaE [Geobacteraceae bacterium GWF2_54_21]HBA72870.1 tRNA (adenosine(37)-N6)-threonylcarbamoyltransferase complex ATPase subunit type 1 TsaE [Geobacter sp.]HCE66267.1 tRNA (adenosine(37)-N6)-threonylcarbamoyltransferase complex ATPase subunit type 1 TsaE [Geobacter sp
MPGRRIVSCSPLETERLGYRLGLILKPGSFLALRGGLGGGKTCFTRGVVSAVSPVSAHMVASPTFAIMNSYPGQVPVHHFDFYRLSGDDDIVELGFEEYFHGKGVCVVEWSERLNNLLPADHLVVEFDYLEDDRRLITITANGPVSADILEQLSVERLKENFL